MKNQTSDKRSIIIPGALVVTVAFLGVFGWLLISTAMPSGCAPGIWLLDRLMCLSPNELGDTFAGAFAPVAFVWLVAAVMLQRDELAEQRKELRQSREVSEAQVQEARNNVAFMAEQTQILSQRDKVEKQEQVDREVLEYIEALNDFIEASFGNIRILRPGKDDGFGNEVEWTVGNFSISTSDQTYKKIKSYADGLIECSITAFQTVEIGDRLKYHGIEELKSIEDLFAELARKSEAASSALQIRVQLCKPDEVASRIKNLTELLVEKGEKIDEIDF